MKISLAATNPCHMWDMAFALHELGHLGTYYSGYPAWKLMSRRTVRRSEDRGRRSDNDKQNTAESIEHTTCDDSNFDNRPGPPGLRPPTSAPPGVSRLGGRSPDLRPPISDLRIKSFPVRTLITYGLLKLPEKLRPSQERLYPWQDYHFDRKVAAALQPCDFIHGLPGQCRDTFRKAKQLGIRTVLNHASGPVREQIRLLREERNKKRIPEPKRIRFNQAYFLREDEEYQLADFHCCASTIVKKQLEDYGVDSDKIWVVPYGADPIRFPKREKPYTGPFRIVFAGQLIHRKGLSDLLAALEISDESSWSLDCFGPFNSETDQLFEKYNGKPSVRRHGSVSQERLAREFQESSVLVLPSLEEAFGLVIIQALQSGLPCIVSSHVGAKDLIHHRESGSIVPFGSPEAILKELRWWQQNPILVAKQFPWIESAQNLVHFSSQSIEL